MQPWSHPVRTSCATALLVACAWAGPAPAQPPGKALPAADLTGARFNATPTTPAAAPAAGAVPTSATAHTSAATAVPTRAGAALPSTAPAAPGIGTGVQAREEPALTLATGTQVDSRDGRWLRRVFGEAFRRLGWRLTVVEMPARRAELALQRGEIDGELVRTALYGEQHPELQRVEAPLLQLSFAIYGNGTGPQARSLDALIQAGGAVIFRRGVTVCEQRLREALPADRLVEISAADSAVRMLGRGRARYLCDMDASLSESLAHIDPGEGLPPFQRLFELGPPLNAYPYLHARNAALAPRLAGVLQQLRTEGRLTPEQARPAGER